MNIEKQKVFLEMDKRFHFPYQISGNCSKCKELIVNDYCTDSYLSYPILGEPEEICLYCSNCDTENFKMIRVDVSVTQL